MKIIIDIDKNLYEGIERRDGALETEYVCDELMKAIDNGTILPKGHGRLIDADILIKAIEEKAKRLSNSDTINGLCGAVALIFDAPTIIEADKGCDTDE